MGLAGGQGFLPGFLVDICQHENLAGQVILGNHRQKPSPFVKSEFLYHFFPLFCPLFPFIFLFNEMNHACRSVTAVFTRMGTDGLTGIDLFLIFLAKQIQNFT